MIDKGPTAITASAETLMEQAGWVTADYLDVAIKAIDQRFGDGYAKANPQLVGAFITAAVSDLGSSMVAQKVQDGSESIASAISNKG